MHFSVPSATADTISSTVDYLRARSVSIKYLKSEQYKYTAVVSKKQGNSAQRNRVKRIIREIMRNRHGIYPSGFYLIYYNKRCGDFDRDELMIDLDKTVAKI